MPRHGEAQFRMTVGKDSDYCRDYGYKTLKSRGMPLSIKPFIARLPSLLPCPRGAGTRTRCGSPCRR